MNKYNVLKKRQQEEFNELPLILAFSNKQLGEGMKKFGLDVNDTKCIVSLGAGCFMKRSDIDKYTELSNKHTLEFKTSLDDEVFVYEMFKSELANHEFGYTYDLTDTLDSLGLTLDEVEGNEVLKKGLNEAM